MNIILLFLIAISLSMDTFSLSIAYGTMSLTKKEISILSIIVGLYHFFMPLIGMFVGNLILHILKVNEGIIILIIFSLIGINMILESFKNEEVPKKMKLFEMLTFGFAVSLDSFTVGIGINNITNSVIIASFIFSMTSLLFTYLGLVCGNKLNEHFGRNATILGGFTLIILGLSYIL